MIFISIVSGVMGVCFLIEAARWTGDHENRKRNYFLGALLLLTAWLTWSAL